MNSDDLFFAFCLELRTLLKKYLEHMGTENLIQTLLQRLALTNTHKNVDFVEVRAGADNLLENNLG